MIKLRKRFGKNKLHDLSLEEKAIRTLGKARNCANEKMRDKYIFEFLGMVLKIGEEEVNNDLLKGVM